MKTPIYLRDLSDDLQHSFIRQWEEESQSDLIKAFEAGDDILVGFFVNGGKCRISGGQKND